MPQLPLTVKTFTDYPQQLALLKQRGMIIDDEARCLRKLQQVSYYRLSGYYYVARQFHPTEYHTIGSHSVRKRLDSFEPKTHFSAVFDLYIFDKKLRLLLLDALERIEIAIRSAIIHEIGRLDALGHITGSVINPKQVSTFQSWQQKADEKLNRARKEDYISWHLNQNKPIPIWVAGETWDFGALSKLVKLLNRSIVNTACKRLNLPPNLLPDWLEPLNHLRNRCAHHSRTWNYCANNPLKMPATLSKITSDRTKQHLYGHIQVIWFIIQQLNPHSDWLTEVKSHLCTKPSLPGCTYFAMGFDDENPMWLQQS